MPIYSVSTLILTPISAKQPRNSQVRLLAETPTVLTRLAFRTFLSDYKVDSLYIEFWMGHKIPEQIGAYFNKSRES